MLAFFHTLMERLQREVGTHLRSLRGRLLYTLLGLLVVLIGLETWTYHTQASWREQHVREEQRRAATAAAQAFRVALDSLYRSQQEIALAALASAMPPGNRELYLQSVRSRHSGMTLLQVTELAGNTRYEAGATARSGTPESFLPDAAAGAKPYLPPLVRDPSQGLRRIRIASLALDAGNRPLGTVAMEFEPESLGRMLPGTEQGEPLLLLDGAGGEVYTSQRARGRVDPELLLLAGYRARASQEAVPLPGNIGAVARVPGTDWTVVHLQPKTDSFGVINGDTATSVIILITILAVVALAMVLVVQISLRPAVTLSAGARLLGSGNLSLRLPPAEVQEFDSVVDAFNRMAAQLEASRNELLEANRTLEQRVQERTRALEAEQEKRLRGERLSTLGLLSSAIAHDLRNPLNNVSIGVQWLQMRIERDGDEKLKGRIEAVYRETCRMDQIICTLLAFARTGEPERRPLDLNELLAEVSEVVHMPGSVQLEVEPDPSVPLVLADRAQLFQVLENLIGNAVQAVGEEGRVRVASERNGAWCALTVSDTGPGIPEELRSTLFDPLVTTKSTGTGLGLALCKRIVEAHGGRISVSSPPGEGASFRVELPLDVEAAHAGR